LDSSFNAKIVVEEANIVPKNGNLRVLWDSQNFRARLQASKHLALKCFSYHWKATEVMLKMASYWPFGHLQHKLWAKERPGVKLAI
jgi:hypothetical protein